MKIRFISIILLVIIVLGGMLMLTSCETQTQVFTLNLVTTPLYTDGEVTTHPYDIEWDDTAFDTLPTEFSPQLAKTALVLSSAAYQYEYALKNLETMGFEHKAKFNYSKEYDPSAVGVIIASRKVMDTTLVAVILRGTFAKEWYSNFDIGKDVAHTGVHEGFNKASEFALKKLEMYMVNYGIDRDHCKFLVTGHSRGAAVANLMSKSLIDTYGPDNIYSYTFATPNTTTKDDADDLRYRGIFNFVNPEDFIAHIPLKSWGFTKYGTTITFPTADTDEQYAQKLSEVSQKYEIFKNREYKTYGGVEKQNIFLETAQTLAPTIKDYYDTKYEIAGLKMSLYEYMIVVAEILNEENIISNGLILLSSDSSAFEPIKDFILSGMELSEASMGFDYEDSLLSYAHTAESYLCWLELYIDNM